MSKESRRQGSLEFSCESIELDVKPGESLAGSFFIYANGKNAEGRIYSSDTRMELSGAVFRGKEIEVNYCFDATAAEAGSIVKGELDIISNCLEYTIPFRVNVQKPQPTCSLGSVKNMLHFTNLPQTKWEEAVELFYSPEFAQIFHRNDRNAWLSYVGLSKNAGNEQNVEEFLIEIGKKTGIVYSFDIEGFILEDVQDSTSRQVCVTRSSWGYSHVAVSTEGDFLSVDRTLLESSDFENNKCNLNIYIDASKLHNGTNSGCVRLSDACNEYTIPVDILMDDEPEKRSRARKRKQALCDAMRAYLDYRLDKLDKRGWAAALEQCWGADDTFNEDELPDVLYYVMLLLAKDRTNEAKWYLDNTEDRLRRENVPDEWKGFYLYLTTFTDTSGEYLEKVCRELELAYAETPRNWRLGWLLLQLKPELAQDMEMRWRFIEDMYENGCSSPLMLCEAALILYDYPTFLIKLGDFEERVLWFGARNRKLTPELTEQLQYLEARCESYSPLLLRTLCEVYMTSKSPQTVASVCHMLILGDKKGAEYFAWYALGVEYAVRVTKLYEYYMMSLELDKYGRSKEKKLEIPKMVLMYFAYQSTLDYELNAFLYAYVVKNRARYPDLEQSYRIAIERFVIEQIKAGHINENLAYLYKYVQIGQFITEETAYAYTPLLFTHRIYVDNSRAKSVVVIHEKVNGESAYPISDGICMIPIYGSEYKLFLQDDNGCRFTKSVRFEDRQLMKPETQFSYVSEYMQGRLSFDIYLCEIDKNYITITPENVRRFKNLAESEQVVESFKKEIRTKLLNFYYDNDMIGELDAFLEDIEADEMESGERAEFIRYMVSRGMFDKAYHWIRVYGVAGVDTKSVARLISKRIVSREYEYDEFMVNVSYYIYKCMKYDENILRYLMRNYEGRVTALKKLWRSASELELDTGDIMYRILKQIEYTGVSLSERDELLLAYADYPNHDTELVNSQLVDLAYEYVVQDAVLRPEIFDMICKALKDGVLQERVCKIALLKFWSENQNAMDEDMAADIVHELLRENIYFPFCKKLAPYVTELHYIRSCVFVEYRTRRGASVSIHFLYRNEAVEAQDGQGDAQDRFEAMVMKEMFDGIFVGMFKIFQGEAVQYYITEDTDDGVHATQSDTLHFDESDEDGSDRFGILNEMLVSLEMQDEETALKMLEEYVRRDFCARELFRVK